MSETQRLRCAQLRLQLASLSSQLLDVQTKVAKYEVLLEAAAGKAQDASALIALFNAGSARALSLEQTKLNIELKLAEVLFLNGVEDSANDGNPQAKTPVGDSDIKHAVVTAMEECEAGDMKRTQPDLGASKEILVTAAIDQHREFTDNPPAEPSYPKLNTEPSKYSKLPLDNSLRAGEFYTHTSSVPSPAQLESKTNVNGSNENSQVILQSLSPFKQESQSNTCLKQEPEIQLQKSLKEIELEKKPSTVLQPMRECIGGNKRCSPPMHSGKNIFPENEYSALKESEGENMLVRYGSAENKENVSKGLPEVQLNEEHEQLKPEACSGRALTENNESGCKLLSGESIMAKKEPPTPNDNKSDKKSGIPLELKHPMPEANSMCNNSIKKRKADNDIEVVLGPEIQVEHAPSVQPCKEESTLLPPKVGDPSSGWHYNLKFGDSVKIYSQEYRQWYPGRVMYYIRTKEDKYKVKLHYQGYSSKYDEVFDLTNRTHCSYIRAFPEGKSNVARTGSKRKVVEDEGMWSLEINDDDSDKKKPEIRHAECEGEFLVFNEPTQ